jgi:hypothetical protein
MKDEQARIVLTDPPKAQAINPAHDEGVVAGPQDIE